MATPGGTARVGPAYVYALRYRWLTPIYDRFIAVTMREGRFRPALIRAADIRGGQRVLDVGCGTGTLAVSVKRSCPDAEVLAIDGDEAVLMRARRKAAAAGVVVTFERALAASLPYEGASFDRVLTSLVLHHLTHDEKVTTLQEIRRVLNSAGELHIADFGPPSNPYARVAFALARRIDGLENTADNASGALPGMLVAAGFGHVRIREVIETVFGSVVLLSARKRRSGGSRGKAVG